MFILFSNKKNSFHMPDFETKGFTLVEILIVVVILSIVGLLAIPMFSSASGFQLSSAANMIAADIEYAKNLAVATQRNYSVVFDVAGNSYHIEDDSGSVIDHPFRGGQYAVYLSSEPRLKLVSISSVNFDGTPKVTFDYLGSPYNGNGTGLNIGQVQVSAGENTMTVTVEPVTGYVTIN